MIFAAWQARIEQPGAILLTSYIYDKLKKLPFYKIVEMRTNRMYKAAAWHYSYESRPAFGGGEEEKNEN